MAAFIQDLQGTFDSVARSVRLSDHVSSLFSGAGLGQHFKPSDADYIVSDFLGVIGLSVAFPVLRYVLQKIMFEPVAKRVVGGPAWAHSRRLPDKLRSKVDKFTESFWKLLVYGTFNALTLRAVIEQPWFRDTSYFWRGWPNHVPTLALRTVYCGELAFMISSVFMLVFWETRRKDFWVMMTHHFVTITLIAFSYYLKFFRVGSMVLLCHDISDVLMEAAKMCKYAGAEAASTAIFVAFMLSWVLARLTYFPFWVIRSTMVESTQVLGHRVPYYELFSGLLLMLVAMHCYWFYLIARIAYRTVATGSTDDVREGDSDDD